VVSLISVQFFHILPWLACLRPNPAAAVDPASFKACRLVAQPPLGWYNGRADAMSGWATRFRLGRDSEMMIMSNQSTGRLSTGVSIRAENLEFSHGVKTVLDGATFTLDSNSRSCLVGRNGVGKSTLLAILARQLEPDSGRLVASKPDYEVAVVPQSIPPLRSDMGALDFLMQQCTEEAAPVTLQARRSAAPDGLVSALGVEETPALFAEARKGLTAFVGLRPKDDNRPVARLSGGQKTRLFILRALSSHADLLLLDEPDNNLDQQGGQWLAEAIKRYPGTVLVVGHRAEFIGEVAERILELSHRDHKVRTYTGSYADYLEHKAASAHLEDKERLHVDRERRRLKAAIQKQIRLAQRSARGPRRARDGDKMASKHKSARAAQKHQAQAAVLKQRLADLPEVERHRTPELKIRIEPAHCGHHPVRMEGLSKGYGRTLFEDFSLRVERGQQIAIVGPNASGKSTLLKMMAGLVEPDEGKVRLGKGVVVGYCPQEQEGLPDVTVLDYFRNHVAMDLTSIRRELHHYQFTEHEVLAPIRSLSAGERARVFLVQFALSHANLLLLDEPTNNLDPQSRDRLAGALTDYVGTILVVSHDSAFLSKFSIDKTLRLGGGAIRTEYGLTL
jgi:ATP-binding cassette subfamily F protein 3